jgi:predicted ATPase/DNA-binding CsgD family transcriptional regulator
MKRPEVRLLTITGTGGVGKTRLALQIASDLGEDFADGVCFLSLAPIIDPDLVLPTIASAFGLSDTNEWPLFERLSTTLREKHLLLVLDNFEQIVLAAAHLANVLQVCPGLTMLVTSRAVLHVRGEYEFLVAPLALPNPERLTDHERVSQVASVALFLERAQAILPDFQLTPHNIQAIAEICVRLDGLPLAIELAAARSKLLPPQALLTMLEHRLAVLTSGAQDMPERQQTLRKALAWSYDLLTQEEQQLFRCLSVFVGGCTLEALEAVCGALGNTSAGLVGSVLECVASLIDKSLVQQTAQEGEQSRLVMLETIREYGLEVLASDGEVEAMHEAHATYYLVLAEQAEPELSGPQQIIWFERLEREHDNLRAALSWFLKQGSDAHRSELALRLGGALAQFWEIRGYVSEGRHWLERVLSISRGVRSAGLAKALIGAGLIASFQDDFGQAEAWCREGLALHRELGDRQGSAAALLIWGYVIWGYAAMMRSNYAQARSLLEEALALFREVGEPVGGVSVLYLLANVLFFQGDYARGHVLLEESRVRTKEAGDVQNYATSLMVLGMGLLFEGDLARAHDCLEECLAVSREVGYKRNLTLSILFLAMVAWLQGEGARARSLLEESQVLLKEAGGRGRMAEVFITQGLLSLGEGDSPAARARIEESLRLSLELDNKWNIAWCLEGLAAVAAAQGEPVRAVWFMSAAQALREAIGTPLPSLSQAMHELTITSVHTQLGEQAFDAAWAEGRAMTPEQILVNLEPMPKPALITPSSASVASLPPPHAGLTPRELEVLVLLSQGLTSSQIAEQLIIGVVTVNFHVRSIYSKLGVSSRAAATRYTLEHHLV